MDSFFDALVDGKPDLAAHALRQLDNLDGFRGVIVCVASLLAWPDSQRSIFDRCLKLRKRGKGGPRKLDEAALSSLGLGDATDFFRQLAAGETHKAGVALDSLPTLQGTHLKLLADIFDNAPGLPSVFQYRLQFKAEGPGTLPNRFRTRAKAMGWKRVLTEAFQEGVEKKEAAIHEVMVRTKRPRSTVMDWMKRLQIPGPKKK